VAGEMIFSRSRQRRITAVALVAGLCAISAVQAQTPDLYTPEMQAIKREYRQQSQNYVQGRIRELNALVDGHLAWARGQSEEHTRSGNITGRAIAQAAVRIFEACAEEMKARNDFTVPENVRRELTQRVQDMQRGKREIEQRYSTLLDPLRDVYFARFSDQVQVQIGRRVAESQMKEWFGLLTATEDRVEAPPGDDSDAPPSAKDGSPAPQTPALPAVLASSGEAQHWRTFARWGAGVRAIEMIRIPVMNITEPVKFSGLSPVSNSSYQTLYRPLGVLRPAPGLVFRVKSVRGRLGVDVMEWPRVENDWTMLVRVRPAGKTPSVHAVDLQVNATAEEATPERGEDGEDGVGDADDDGQPAERAPPVQFTVESRPPGAEVFVDGVRQMAGALPATTPCRIEAPPGRREIRLKMPGFHDGVLADFEVKPGATAQWTFRLDRGAQKFTIRAFAHTAWVNSRIHVEKGDQVTIETFGTWRCGEGGAMTGADGYSSRQYPQYYRNPHGDRRLLKRAGAQYGVLLMRIGENGPVGPIGRQRSLTAPAAGVLYFGINESPGFLGDNAGSITLQIETRPGS
jgi:hypothetical protein